MPYTPLLPSLNPPTYTREVYDLVEGTAYAQAFQKSPLQGGPVQKGEGNEGCVIVSTVSILLNNVVPRVRKEFGVTLTKMGKLVKVYSSFSPGIMGGLTFL